MSISLRPLNQQVIVITGASSGIGLTTAESAAKAGAKVILASRNDAAQESIVQRIKASGGSATYVVCDVANRADVEKVAEAAVAEFGRIDTWVNNAGGAIYGRVEETSEADARQLFETNFWGVFNGSQVALKYLRRSGGALINIGSEVSDAYAPLLGVYTATKHAVKGFTDALRVEVQEIDKAPVSITLIQPTAVDTPFAQHAKNYLDQEAALPTPMIDPQQVADAILSAAVKPTRDVRVGLMAKINTTVSTLAPGLADKMSAKQADKMHYEEHPRNPDGALHAPAEAGQTHGTKGPRA